MLLQELFTTLTTGAYTNTALGSTDGVLKDIYYEKVVNIINLGIVELYKRFKFLENELSLHVTPDTLKYYLRPDRAVLLNDISSAQYIEKEPDVNGFLNIIKVTGVYTSSGAEIRMNYNGARYIGNVRYDEPTTPTIMELAPDILQITNIVVPEVLTVVYQSYPNKIIAADVIPDEYSLNIPEIAVDPLVAYIAAKTFKPMGANDSTANADKSASYEQQYELACQKIMLYGLSVQDSTERDSFDSKGWA